MLKSKKGFTLAELLIVIAIIAILIAIAIPVFSGQLENARLQADHSNLRSAYAIVQTANIVGDTEMGWASGTTYFYCTDGTFKAAADAADVAVVIQGTTHNGSTGSCGTCVVPCNGYSNTGSKYISVAFDSTTDKVWELAAASALS